MHIYFDLQLIEIAFLAAVVVCKASKKHRSVTESMTNDDVGLISRAQCISITIQMIRSKAMDKMRY